MSEKKTLTLKQIDPSKPRIVRWPVDVQIAADGGTVTEFTLETEFLVLTSERINALSTDAALREFNSDKTKPKYATPLLWEVVKGFPGFREDEGGPVLDAAISIPMLLNESAVSASLQGAYFRMVNGLPAKN